MNKELKPAISVNLKRPLIRIHKDTLHILGDPEYVLLLVNPQERSIAILPSDRSDVTAHHISKYNLIHKKSFELYSTNLIRNLRVLAQDWLENRTYRMYGYQVQGQQVVKFLMSEAMANT